MPDNLIAPKTIAIIGAGSRGTGFAQLIGQYPLIGKVVAVAEPRTEYRQDLAKTYGIGGERQFKTWQDFVAHPRMCDAVVVATMDREHVGPAVACLNQGYAMLLEKPMATTLEDCRAIEAAQRKTGVIMGVCHSMRYHKHFRKVRDLIAGGAIGQLITFDQVEPVGFWHQAHSYVRGNWRNEGQSSFMLLAKCCHDIDYMIWLAERPCRRVASFGSLSYFRRENAPAGAPDRCTDGCPVEATCAYSALKQYVRTPHCAIWPADVISHDHSMEAHLKAIQTGPYGRCVFRCDNDVVDHQVVTMEFDGNITATFTMTAFWQGGGRLLRAHGTEGDLTFDDAAGTIVVRTFRDMNTTRIELGLESGSHGGGDDRVVREWLQALHTGDGTLILTNAQESLRTHTVVFAAEQSRREKRMIDMEREKGSHV